MKKFLGFFFNLQHHKIDHYSKQIKENKTIVTGDFNLYLKEEKKNKDADLQPINELLKSLGLTSVYREEKKHCCWPGN